MVGSIFIWKEFDRQADKRIKVRLFIYFGQSPAFIEPIHAYIATTTGKTEYYKNGGRFSNNNKVVITLALKEQEFFAGSQKIDLEILILRGVFFKIGTIIRGKSNFLHICSI